MILEEFDYDKEAILNPAHFMESQIITKGLKGKMPKVAVSCFERKGFNRILELLNCKEVAVSKNANDDFPIYVTTYKDKTKESLKYEVVILVNQASASASASASPSTV